MKRSEMIEVISGVLKKDFPFEEYPETSSESILEAIEEAGMLPPATIEQMQELNVKWDEE